MAVLMEWQKAQLRKGEEEEIARIIPRLKGNGVVSGEDLVSLLFTYQKQFSPGTWSGVITDLATVLAIILREGKGVELPKIGTLRLKLGTKSHVTSETKRRTSKVEVKGVKFAAADCFLQEIGKVEFTEIADNTSIVPLTLDELREQLTQYFKTNEKITRSEIEQLYRLPQSTAILRIKMLCKEGFLKCEGRNRNTYYTKATAE